MWHAYGIQVVCWWVGEFVRFPASLLAKTFGVRGLDLFTLRTPMKPTKSRLIGPNSICPIRKISDN